MDPVFASAILSELIASKQIKTSHMKIGSSPLYLLPNQSEKLEEKTEHLKQAEKQAQEKLKQNKILFDQKEEPAIRVSLRNLKDFAIPFKFKEEILWKYAFTPQEEIDKILLPKKKEEEPKKPEVEIKEDVPKAWEVKKEEIIQAKEDSKKIESIFEKPKEEPKEEPKEIKPNETFLKEIENFLEKQNTKIISIEEVDKKKLIATIDSDSKQIMLFAFNKKRINEIELFKCYKHAKKANLTYRIITKEDPTKKMNETIDAYKSLVKIEKLDD